jgi:hypothetical protein
LDVGRRCPRCLRHGRRQSSLEQNRSDRWLITANATYADAAQIPNDGCVDAKRKRLFVANKGIGTISEHNTGDLAWVRDIPSTGTDCGPRGTHFKIYCAGDTLYVVDGAWAPALFTVTALDTASSKVTDQRASVAAVDRNRVSSWRGNLQGSKGSRVQGEPTPIRRQLVYH